MQDTDAVTIRLTESQRVEAVKASEYGFGHTRWTATINSQVMTEVAGVSVTQPNGIKDWTISLSSSGISELAGVVVQRGSAQGVLKNGLVNVWTMGITSATITESQGVAVTQANGFKIWTIAIASQMITEAQGAPFYQGLDYIGVLNAACASTWTMTLNNVGITENQNVAVTQSGGAVAGTLYTSLSNVWPSAKQTVT